MNISFRSLLIFLIIDFPIQLLSQTTYFVSTSGSNNNNGSNTNPFETIQYAIDISSPQDTIQVDTGTYYENLICNKSITIMSSDPLDTNVVLNTTINGSDTASCLWIVGSNPMIDGLTIEHGFTSGSPGGGGIHIQSNSNAIIDHCYIQNNSGPQYTWCNGIQIEEGSSIVRNTTLRWNTSWRYTLFNHLSTATFENLHVYGNVSNGAFSENSAIQGHYFTTKILNCVVVNNQSNGIGFFYGLNYPNHERSINHSLIYGNTGYGLILGTWAQETLNQDKHYCEVVNSIIGSNDEGSILVNPFINQPTYSTITEISHSWIESGFDTIGTSSKVIINIDSTNIIDSVFLETDLTLTPNSPAIGSGDSNLTLLGYTITSPNLDYIGNNRPLPANSNPDMGPYESVLGTPVCNIIIDTLIEFSCDSLVSYDSSKVWYQSGIYYDTILTSTGCDSVFVIQLTINNTSILYVDTLGNDSNDGSFSHPLREIQTAIDRSCEGDTILINRGSYSGHFLLGDKNLVISSNYIFSNDSSDISSTIIDGGLVDGSIFLIDHGQDTTNKFIGLTFQNGYSSNGGSVFKFENIGLGSSSSIIDHCIIQNNSGGALSSYFCGSQLAGFANGPRLEIRNTIFRYNSTNSSKGTCVWSFVSDPIIINCEFYGNGSSFGSSVYSWRSQPRIENCVFSRQSNSIFLRSDVIPNAEVELIGNTFFDNGFSVKGDPQGSPNGPLRIYSINNIFYGTESPSVVINGSEFNESNNLYRDSLTCDSSSLVFNDVLFGDPGFIDSLNFDFNLSSSSQCIGRGTDTITLNNRFIEISGFDNKNGIRPNPVGSNPDIGAFESIIGVPVGMNTPVLNSFDIIKVFPNPTKGMIQLKSSEVPYHFEIKDITGKLIKSHLITETNHSIDLSSIENGVYIYTIVKDNTRYSDKLILSK